jgi:hypothetical protein
LNALSITGVEHEGERGGDCRKRFSAALAELAAAAARVSDRLARRHFSLLDRDLHTVSS